MILKSINRKSQAKLMIFISLILLIIFTINHSGLSDGNVYTLYYRFNDSSGNNNTESTVHTFGVQQYANVTVSADACYCEAGTHEGDDTVLLLEKDTDCRAILKFDASAVLSEGDTIGSCFVWVYSGSGADNLATTIHNVTARTDEWVENDVNWTHYDSSNAWGTAGGDIGSTLDTTTVIAGGGWHKFNVTDVCIDGIMSFVLKTLETPGWEYYYIDSREGTNAPYLNVTYVPGIRINNISMSNTKLLQGDKFNITINFNSTVALKNVTVRYVVVNSTGSTMAYIESDFFDISTGNNQNKTYEFKWTDFKSSRTGTMNISNASIKWYPGDMTSPTEIANYDANLQFNVTEIKDDVLKKFISRENSLWWLTEMGWVNSAMVYDNDLDYCVMYGGYVDGTLTNEEYYADGSNVKGYWEITGYATRVLALEYERTGDIKYRDLAKKMGDVIIKNLNDGSVNPENSGTIYTQQYYNGTEVDTYKDMAYIFDHGQVQMGLLELGRVMEEKGDAGYQTYKDGGERIGKFLYFVYENNSNVLPQIWYRNNLTNNGVNATGTKEVIGMKYLYKNTNNESYKDIAESELNRIYSNNASYSGSGHHGRSYIAYGFIRGFEWFNNISYLEEAKKWATKVSQDMDANGKLSPEEYSRIPAQSQVVRNNILIWKYTGNDTFLDWADSSSDYLTNTDNAWVYNQTILKLGRHYRESGGQYNYYDVPELTSWGTEFHIDAFYHYLHHKYGDIYIDRSGQKVISMINTPTVSYATNEVNVTINGTTENLGIYFNSSNDVQEVYLDGEPIYYFTNKTARVYPYSGNKKIRVIFGTPISTHVRTSNSNITNTTFLSSTEFFVEFNGRNQTDGKMKVYWNTTKPTSLLLDGNTLTEDVSWTWNSSISEISVNYSHNGAKQNLTITAHTTKPITAQQLTKQD